MTGPAPASARWLQVARKAVAAAARRAGFRAAPGTSPTAAARVAGDGSLRVGPVQLRAVLAALNDAAVCQDNHGGQPTVAAAYRRVWRRLTSRLEPVPGPGSATPGEAGESVPGPALAEAVQALPGDDKTWLLSWLADTSPGVARTGLAAVERYHAQARERQRVRRNRARTVRKAARRRAS